MVGFCYFFAPGKYSRVLIAITLVVCIPDLHSLCWFWVDPVQSLKRFGYKNSADTGRSALVVTLFYAGLWRRVVIKGLTAVHRRVSGTLLWGWEVSTNIKLMFEK